MGVAGASLMAALPLYSVRKRMRTQRRLGPVRHWFRFHMVAGVAGPVLVLERAGEKVRWDLAP